MPGQRRAVTATSRPVREGRTEKLRCGEVDCELYVNTITQVIFDKHRLNPDNGLIVILFHERLGSVRERGEGEGERGGGEGERGQVEREREREGEEERGRERGGG